MSRCFQLQMHHKYVKDSTRWQVLTELSQKQFKKQFHNEGVWVIFLSMLFTAVVWESRFIKRVLIDQTYDPLAAKTTVRLGLFERFWEIVTTARRWGLIKWMNVPTRSIGIKRPLDVTAIPHERLKVQVPCKVSQSPADERSQLKFWLIFLLHSWEYSDMLTL